MTMLTAEPMQAGQRKAPTSIRKCHSGTHVTSAKEYVRFIARDTA
jgi:hypothetical protein